MFFRNHDDQLVSNRDGNSKLLEPLALEQQFYHMTRLQELICHFELQGGHLFLTIRAYRQDCLANWWILSPNIYEYSSLYHRLLALNSN
jgi:hypothetical protein